MCVDPVYYEFVELEKQIERVFSALNTLMMFNQVWRSYEASGKTNIPVPPPPTLSLIDAQNNTIDSFHEELIKLRFLIQEAKSKVI